MKDMSMHKKRALLIGAMLFGIAQLSTFDFQLSTLRAADNTGGVWTEVGVSKALPYNLSVEASAGHRTLDWFDWSSRTDVSAGLSYKVNKYVKFGLGYTFIAKNNQDEWKDHISDTTEKWDGYNVDDNNWALRHRLSLDVTGTYRVSKLIRFSLRERYQYTYQSPRDVDRTKMRDKDFDGIIDKITYTTDHKKPKNRHLLRSRLKISLDKKDLKWEPYVSVETHNDFSKKMHLDKIRTIVGVDYSITKKHQVGLGYVFNHENDDDGDQNIHAISVGYNFKF